MVKYIKYIERKRKEALYNRDALNFARYCDLSGTHPEDELLYEQGKAQSLYKQKTMKLKKPKRKKSRLEKITEKEFLRKGSRLNLQDYASQANYKRELLMEYFPNKFGPKGSQPIKDYALASVGFLFKRVYNSYNKRK